MTIKAEDNKRAKEEQVALEKAAKKEAKEVAKEAAAAKKWSGDCSR